MINLSVRIIYKIYMHLLFAGQTDALDDTVTRSTDTSFFFKLSLYIFYI